MFANVFSPEFYVTNGISLFVLVMAFRKPRLGRLWMALIFVSAAVVNGVLAVKSPQSYLAFANVAVFDWYTRYIEGPFSEHIPLIVGTIAFLQLLTGFFMLHKGQLGKAAFMAGMIFFWAIAPLGAGAAFPAPVLLAAACLVILLKWGKLNTGKGRQTQVAI
ncbi:hypothetical protein [Chitinophaga sp. 22620]|uniref:hypothetical protein n=1 Tax=Chitinophaga sp. 22620 TaxID=3453952 RepID=UPI003F856D9F